MNVVPFFCAVWLLLGVLVRQSPAQSSTSPHDTLIEKSRLAKQALLDGQYAKAIALYREVVNAFPDNPDLRLNLAFALVKAGHPAAAAVT